MNSLEAIRSRHSVRAYQDKAIPSDLREKLTDYISEINAESGLSIRIIFDEPDGFDSRLADYGNFRNVNNYIVLAGEKDHTFDYRCGYYGEKIVLHAQKLGLNTCWVAMSFNKKNVKKLLGPGETLCMVIAIGFGEDQGKVRRSKKPEDVSLHYEGAPDWFFRGVIAALMAPTAINQQKFLFDYNHGNPAVSIRGAGPHTRVDLGIVSCHFDIASGHNVRNAYRTDL